MSFISDQTAFPQMPPLQASSRFDPYFDAFGLSLKQSADGAQRTITLIARSPASPVAQAFALNLGRFEAGAVEIGIIFTQIAPAEALDFLLRALEGADAGAPEHIIRWAKNRALLDAHERLTLGHALCWTGDTMRRTENTRSVLERVDDVNPVMLAEAHASFHAMWKASKPLPKALLTRPAPCFTAQPHEQQNSRFSPSMQSDAHASRLEEYLRLRRH